MRLLVDSNILLYAANRDSPEHAAARRVFDHLRKEAVPWCVTWGILYEFLRVATHARVFPRPLDARRAWGFVEALLAGGAVTVLVPSEQHASFLRQVLDELPHPAGNLFHDIHTATILREHGVPEILTADTAFLQFRFLKVTDPVHRPWP